MAYNVKYRATAKSSTNGNEDTHEIEIQKKDYTGAVIDIRLNASNGGFKHIYENLDPKDLYKNPIQKSRVELFLQIRDGGNTDADLGYDGLAILQEIFSAEEDEFKMIRKINGDTFWTGWVLPDLLEYPEGEYAYSGKIVAKDLTALSGIEYAPVEGRQRIIGTIADLLNDLNLGLDIFTYTSWVTADTIDSQDFLNQIYNERKALRELSQNNGEEDQPVNHEELLKRVLANYGLFIRQSDNAWRIYQLTTLDESSEINEYHYNEFGTQLNADSKNLIHPVDNESLFSLKGGNNQINSALNKIKMSFKHRTKLSGLDMPRDFDFNLSDDTRLFSQGFLSNGTQSISFSSKIEIVTNDVTPDNVTMDFELEAGGWWYKVDEGIWVNSQYVNEVDFYKTGDNNRYSFWNRNPFEFTTIDNPPTDADGVISVTIHKPILDKGTLFRVKFRESSFAIDNNNVEQNSYSIDYELGQSGNFSRNYEHTDTWFGDGPVTYSVSALRFSANDDDITNGSWQIKPAASGYRSLHENLGKEMLNVQRNSTRNLSGKLKGNYSPRDLILYKGNSLFFLGGTFTLNGSRWDGNFLEFKTETAGSDEFRNIVKFDGGVSSGSTIGGSSSSTGGGGGIPIETADDRYFQISNNLSEGDPWIMRSMLNVYSTGEADEKFLDPSDVFGTSNQIVVEDNDDGSVTISTPQDIAPTSSPEFANIDLTGTLKTKDFGLSTDFSGTGWRVTNAGSLNIETLTVRQSATFRELILDQLSAIGGSTLLSGARGKVRSVDGNHITLEDPSDKGITQFAVGSFFVVRIIDVDGSELKFVAGIVTAVNGMTVTLSNADTDLPSVDQGKSWGSISSLSKGDVIVERGHLSSSSRQNIIYQTATDSDAPVTKYLSGIDSLSAFNDNSNVVTTVGDLTNTPNLSDGTETSGYGFYAKDNAYLDGTVIAQKGKIANWDLVGNNIESVSDGSGLVFDSDDRSIRMKADDRTYDPLVIDTDYPLPAPVAEKGSQRSMSTVAFPVTIDESGNYEYTSGSLIYPEKNEGIEVNFELDLNAGGTIIRDCTVYLQGEMEYSSDKWQNIAFTKVSDLGSTDGYENFTIVANALESERLRLMISLSVDVWSSTAEATLNVRNIETQQYESRTVITRQGIFAMNSPDSYTNLGGGTVVGGSSGGGSAEISWTDVLHKPDTTGEWASETGFDNRYAEIAHVSNNSNPHAVTAAQIGLGNVDNKALANVNWSDLALAKTDVSKSDVGLGTGADPTFNSLNLTNGLSVGGNATITGNLTVNGTQFITNTETVEIEDNLAIINKGETGDGVSAGFAGWEADRGTLINYRWGFDESSDLWKIGEVGSLQAVATREDNPSSNGIAQWNNSKNRFDSVSVSSLLSGTSNQVSVSHQSTGVAKLSLPQNIHSGASPTFSGATFTGSVSFDKLEANTAQNRFEVWDSTPNEKVAMGYLEGLPKNDGGGDWGSNNYGFWVREGDRLTIDGDVEYVDGDWLIEQDASVRIQNGSSGNDIIRVGTDSGDKGLFLYDSNEASVVNLTHNGFEVVKDFKISSNNGDYWEFNNGFQFGGSDGIKTSGSDILIGSDIVFADDVKLLWENYADGAVEDLEIGGRNWLKRTKEVTLSAGSNDSHEYHNYRTSETLKEGKVYTLSGNIEFTEGGNDKISTLVRKTGGNGSQHHKPTVESDGSFEISFTAGTDEGRIYIYAGEAGDTYNNSVILRNVQLELGTKATDWTPAPEDTQSVDWLNDAGSLATRNSVNGTYIDDDSIATVHIDVNTLSSISADIGTVTAGKLVSSENNLEFDLNNGELTADTFTLDAGSIYMTDSGGGRLTAGTGNNTVGITGNSDTDVVMWAGRGFGDRENAPFRIKRNGQMRTTSAILEGDISADNMYADYMEVQGSSVWTQSSLPDPASAVDVENKMDKNHDFQPNEKEPVVGNLQANTTQSVMIDGLREDSVYLVMGRIRGPNDLVTETALVSTFYSAAVVHIDRLGGGEYQYGDNGNVTIAVPSGTGEGGYSPGNGNKVRVIFESGGASGTHNYYAKAIKLSTLTTVPPDNTPPEITGMSVTGNYNSRTISVSTGSEPGDLFEYQFRQGDSAYSNWSGIGTSESSSNTHTMSFYHYEQGTPITLYYRVRVRDASGNWSGWAQRSIVVEGQSDDGIGGTHDPGSA